MFFAFYNQVPFIFPNPDLLSVFSSVAHLKASRPLIRVLVINDNGLWINNYF
jgi:hypothetical protein